MKITRKIDTTNAKYDLLDLKHEEIMRLYNALSHYYSYINHLPIDEVEEELPKKLQEIISESVKTI